MLEETASDSNNDSTKQAPHRWTRFRLVTTILGVTGGVLAAALTPIDIASWAGDSDMHINSQLHYVIVVVIYLLVMPALVRLIVKHTLKEHADETAAAQERMVEKVVDDKLTARRDELINTFTELIRELLDEIQPKHQHMINQAVRNAIKPQIAVIKQDLAKGLSAATRAGLIAGAQQKVPQQRGTREDTPTNGVVTRFRQTSGD